MKITQSKDYKKPLYALGITAALMAVSVTAGCGGPIGYAGGMDVATQETEEVIALAGSEICIEPSEDTTTVCTKDCDETINPPVLEGVIDVADPTE
jgi:hypothetical protein